MTSRAAGRARLGMFASSRRAVASVAWASVASTGLLAGCQSYVIEYRYRPEFHQMASETDLPDEVVTDDGRIIRFVSTPLPQLRAQLEAQDRGEVPEEAGESIEIWQEQDDGTVEIRCITPEHVLANTMNCLRFERYDVLWEALLAERTREEFIARGGSPAAFAEWCAKHRNDLMATLNRMGFGFLGGDVILDNLGDGVLRARFTPRVGDQFKFNEVRILHDPPGMKLLTIR
ncbi:MAG: hypothetical protein RLZZ565_435 [Planctomycetota bacterium]